MTLIQAFTEWAAIHENTALAARSRSAVNTVLLKKYGDEPVQKFTAFYVRKLMQECKDPQSMKTKAASLLVHVLTYAAEKDKCLKPDFDFTIANSGATAPAADSPAEPPEEQPLEAPQRNEFGEFMKGSRPWNAGKHPGVIGGREKVPVVQLHPDTLQEVARFDSIAAAFRALHIYNIDAAIRDHRQRGGYYWARQEDVEGFQPGYKKGPTGKSWSRKKKEVKKALPHKQRRPGSGKSTLERGTGSGTESQAPSRKVLLSSFSDAELRAELEHRGWYGTLYQRLEFMANRQEHD